MTEPRSKARTALWSSLAAALSAAATLLAQKAIAPAIAQERAGTWATAAQVQALATEVRDYRDQVRAVLQRLRDVEIEQAEARGARAAVLRERAR